KPQRVIERDDVTHRSDAQALGTRAGAGRVKTGRRHPAFVGAEMMLDAEAVIEAKLVAEHQLAPQFLVAPMRRHIGLGPDMTEVRELMPLESVKLRRVVDQRLLAHRF